MPRNWYVKSSHCRGDWLWFSVAVCSESGVVSVSRAMIDTIE